MFGTINTSLSGVGVVVFAPSSSWRAFSARVCVCVCGASAHTHTHTHTKTDATTQPYALRMCVCGAHNLCCRIAGIPDAEESISRPCLSVVRPSAGLGFFPERNVRRQAPLKCMASSCVFFGQIAIGTGAEG